MQFAISSTFFFLREVEAGTPVVAALTFDDDAMEVAWSLPASKSDHIALGATFFFSYDSQGRERRQDS